MKLVVEEAESSALAVALDSLGSADRLVSSWLLHTELHCGAGRRPELIEIESVTAVLDRVTLADLTRMDLLEAPGRGPGLRSQDALHLTAALRVGAEAIITYDDEQADAARSAGLRVLQPA